MTKPKVHVIYTGGTIGSRPRDDDDPDSPQYVVPWQQLENATPELGKLQKHIDIEAYSFANPLDSCNIGPAEWAEMATAIVKHYDACEGFVILHGTDTMVYTAAALSFMLRNLGKPVVITGAQRSAMVDIRNDATQNFITAVTIACPSYSKIPAIPEVVIYFGGRILRGNRTVKMDTSGYQAYTSPSIPPLGEAGNRVSIDETLLRHGPSLRLQPILKLERAVAPIFIYPGIQETEMVRRQLDVPGLRAAIVHAYGSGDIPTAPEFLQVFRDAHDRGIILVAVTQCMRGAVELGIYDTSAMLLAAGFISADDISKEAAQCKLMTLLGDPDIGFDEVEDLFQRNLAGEQSKSTFVTRFPGADRKEVSGPAQKGDAVGAFRVPARPLAGEEWDPGRIHQVVLWLRGARMPGAEAKPSTVTVFANANDGDVLDDSHPGYAGTYRKYWSPDVPVLTFDVTRAVAPIARPGGRFSFTVVMETPGLTLSWDSVELAVVVRETAR
ncbi:MAG: asparaginase [Vicinamibacterales bacterium]